MKPDRFLIPFVVAFAASAAGCGATTPSAVSRVASACQTSTREASADITVTSELRDAGFARSELFLLAVNDCIARGGNDVICAECTDAVLDAVY